MFRLPVKQPTLARGFATIALVASAASVTLNSADAGRRSREVEDTQQVTLSGQPIMAVVSIKDQHVTIYDGAGGTMRARVSSGRTDYETPVGIYSVLEKEEEHYSNVYDDASMPFMQRITWSGVALHAGALPGYPASHGCVRLPDIFAQRLFPLTKVGMRVIIAYDDVAPVEISHPLLLKPSPLPQAVESATPLRMSYQDPDGSDNSSTFDPDLKQWPARQTELDALKSIAAGKQSEADTATSQAEEMKQAIAEKKAPRDKAAKVLRNAEAAKKSADDRIEKADKGLANAKSQKATKNWQDAKDRATKDAEAAAAKVQTATEQLKTADAELAAVTKEAAPALAAMDAAVAAANEAKHKTKPTSIFISLKTQRLYVRQGYEPVFDAPVTIADPDKPIGTHVYTAVDFTNGGKDLRWTAVTLEHKNADYAFNDDGQDRLSDATVAPQTDLAKATAALDRITISPDVQARLAGAVWPGSSLIISDEAASKETGRSTDFIVLISTEPQGGIKKRPKQFFRQDNFFGDSADDYYYGYDRYSRRMYPRQRSFFGWW